MSHGEELLAVHLRAAGIPFTREFRFAPPRRWRADFAFDGSNLLCEVEGGTWTQGRHVRGQGFENDAEKHAHALMEGYVVLRVTTGQVRSGHALRWIERLLETDNE